MTRPRVWVALIAMMMSLALLGQAVAQTPASSSDAPEGLTNVSARAYINQSAISGTPMASPAAGTPATPGDGLLIIGMGQLTFDSEDHARAAMEDLRTHLSDHEVEVGMHGVPVDGLGDEAVQITSRYGDVQTYGYFVRQGDRMFNVSVNGLTEEDAFDAANALTVYILEQEPSTTPVTFHEDGTSTGGFYDMLPPTGDPLLLGTVPMSDSEGIDMFTGQ